MVVNWSIEQVPRSAEGVSPGRNEFAGSFAKGLALLEHMSSMARPATLAELAAVTGQSRASIRRFALTLVHVGIAEQKDGSFCLRAGALKLDARSREVTVLMQVAGPMMRALVDRFREASAFGRHDGHAVEILAYERCDRLMSLNLDRGSRLPIARSAQGHVLLAHMTEAEVEAATGHTPNARPAPATLARIREQGYSFVDGELEEGVRSLAMAVRGPGSGSVVGSMSLCAHSNRMSEAEMIADGVPALCEAITAVEKAARERYEASR